MFLCRFFVELKIKTQTYIFNKHFGNVGVVVVVVVVVVVAEHAVGPTIAAIASHIAIGAALHAVEHVTCDTKI